MNSDRVLTALVLAICILAGGFYLWYQRQTNQVETPAPITLSVEPPVELAAEVPVVEDKATTVIEDEIPPVFTSIAEERKIILPPGVIDGSDFYVKKAIIDLVPSMQEWLITGQQLRKWVLFIDLMADGNLMKQDRPLNYPMSRFEVLPQSEKTFLPSKVNDGRMSLLITAITAADVDLAVYYYQKWLPLLEKGYRELGKKGTFHSRVKKAIDRIVDVKPLVGSPLLTKKGGVIFRYVDPQLESATDVEKLVWRLGPNNGVQLQAYLKQLREKLPK